MLVPNEIGTIAILPLSNEIGHSAERMDVLRSIQSDAIIEAQALSSIDLLVEITKLTLLNPGEEELRKRRHDIARRWENMDSRKSFILSKNSTRVKIDMIVFSSLH